MKPEYGWFSDIDEDATNEYKWQPCLNAKEGTVPSLPVWFRSKKECDDWIKEQVIGMPFFA